MIIPIISFFFFFNDTATTEIYTLSLHDALPISPRSSHSETPVSSGKLHQVETWRSEEHTSELQSQSNLVCRLLLEKKKKKTCVTTTLEDLTITPPYLSVVTSPHLSHYHTITRFH